MKRRFLNSKIHKATLTDSRIDYEGSCEIDRILLESAGIEPYEQIDIYNITNGERFNTDAIEGKPESGSICVNGAACHKADIGHNIIICAKGILLPVIFFLVCDWLVGHILDCDWSIIRSTLLSDYTTNYQEI